MKNIDFKLVSAGYNLKAGGRRALHSGPDHARGHDPPAGHPTRWGRNQRDQRDTRRQPVGGATAEDAGKDKLLVRKDKKYLTL